MNANVTLKSIQFWIKPTAIGLIDMEFQTN